MVSARSAANKKRSKPAVVAAPIAVTAMGKESKKMKTALAKSEESRFDFVFGDRPSHVHTCGGDDTYGQHTWMCNSPYCQDMPEQCPTHGGVPPVRSGREPWRK